MGKRIWCAVSGHGYGHFSQTAPILNALARRLPDLTLHVTGNLPRALIARNLTRPFTHDPQNRDVGLIQSDPMTVDLAATAAAVNRLHREWPERLERETARMRAAAPDLVLADIPYLPLAACHRLGIPGIAIASLTWDEVLAAYFPRHPALPEWLETIRAAYRLTTLALLPAPALPTHPFPRAEATPPVTTPGHARSDALRAELGISDPRPLVLVTLGGIPASGLPIPALAQDDRFHWLLDTPPTDTPADHVHFLATVRHWPFNDLTASVDGIVSKPGYGMAVAAGINRKPFLYVRRGTFPDETPIGSWIEKRGRARELTGEAFRQGQFGEAMRALMALPPPPQPDADGAETVAELLCERFLR